MHVQNSTTNINNINKAPSFHSRSKLLTNLGKDTFERQINPTKNKVALVGLGTLIGSLLAYKTNETSVDKCIEAKNSENFEEYKNNIIKFLEKHNYNSNFIDEIKCSENINDINFNLRLFISRTILDEDILYDEEFNLLEKLNRREFTPEVNNFVNEYNKQKADLCLPLIKIITTDDTNKEVLKIKKELKEKYGQEKLLFNNDLEFANACKEAFEILAKNKIPYNGTIISFEDLDACGISLVSSEGNGVLVNKDYWEMEPDNLVHIILHEIIHSLQPKDVAFNLQTIPEKYQPVISQVSDYAEGNNAHEIHCELYVKKLLKELSKEENELFEYLGGDFLK